MKFLWYNINNINKLKHMRKAFFTFLLIISTFLTTPLASAEKDSFSWWSMSSSSIWSKDWSVSGPSNPVSPNSVKDDEESKWSAKWWTWIWAWSWNSSTYWTTSDSTTSSWEANPSTNNPTQREELIYKISKAIVEKDTNTANTLIWQLINNNNQTAIDKMRKTISWIASNKIKDFESKYPNYGWSSSSTWWWTWGSSWGGTWSWTWAWAWDSSWTWGWSSWSSSSWGSSWSWESKEEENKRLQDEIKKDDTKIKWLKWELEKKKEELIWDDLKDVDKEVKKTNKIIWDFSDELKEVDKKIGRLKELEAKANKSGEEESELSDLKSENSTAPFETQKSRLEKWISKLNEDLKKLKDKKLELNKKFINNPEVQQLEKEIKKAENEKKEKEKKLNQNWVLTEDQKKKLDEYEDLQEDIEKKEKAERDAENKHKKAEALRKKAENDLKELEKTRKEINWDIEKLKERLDNCNWAECWELTERLAKKEKELEQIDDSINAKKADIVWYSDAEKKAKDTLDKAKEELKNAVWKLRDFENDTENKNALDWKRELEKQKRIENYEKRQKECSEKQNCLDTADFKFPIWILSATWNEENKFINKDSDAKKTTNRTLGLFIQKLSIWMWTLAIILMLIWVWHMILHAGQEDVLWRWKTMFISSIIAIAISLSSYILVELVIYIVYG